MVTRVSPTPGPPSAAPRPERRGPDLLTLLCVVVVAAAVAVRVGFAANQSLWADEMFSVDQVSGGVGRLLDLGSTEVHTPFSAALLWVWVHVGGTHTAWTRLLGVTLGLASVVAAELGLRHAGVSVRARRLAVALTAANGFAIVYAQEVRPYALALLGATGLTAATVRRLTGPGGGPGAAAGRAWPLWALITATAHLLGAVLVGVVTVVLTAVAWRAGRRGAARRDLLLGAAALLPQLAWIVAGTARGGFAAGTSWIVAPTPGDAWLLATTVFGAGGLTPRADGFGWTSPVGVLAVAVVLVGAAALRGRGGTAGPDPDVREAAADRRLGLALVGVAVATLAGTFAVSQVVHLWTLRNMIVVVPPLTWGVAWIAASLPGTRAGRRAVAVTVLAVALVSLVPVSQALARPYKTDWRGLVHELERAQAEDPAATLTVFGVPPAGFWPAADQSRDDPALRRLTAAVDARPGTRAALADVRRVPGRQVVVFYGGIGRPVLPDVEQTILARLADPSCRPAPVYGFVVVSCP